MAKRPGIMLYFDVAEPLGRLGYDEKGRLLEAMLAYGQFGVIPELEGILMVVWGFIQPKLDADAKSYRRKVVKNTYSSYCAKERNADRIPLALDDWLEREGIDAEWNRTVPDGIERCPTANANQTSDSYPTPIPKAITGTDGGGKGEEELPGYEDFETLRQKKIALMDFDIQKGNIHLRIIAHHRITACIRDKFRHRPAKFPKKGRHIFLQLQYYFGIIVTEEDAHM